MNRLYHSLTVVFLIAIVAICWQWRTLGELNASEDALRREREHLQATRVAVSPAVVPRESGLTETELPRVQQLLASAGTAMHKINGGRDEVKEFWSRSIELTSALERATPEQVALMFDEWTRTAGGSKSATSVFRLMKVIAELNPQGALQLIVRGDDFRTIREVTSPAFESWFRTDPQAMRAWIADWRRAHPANLSEGSAVPPGMRADESGFSKESFLQRQTLLWESAANVLSDPAGTGAAGIVKGIRAEGSSAQNQPVLSSLAAQLDNTEARVQFLRSLHAASDGKFDIFSFMIPLAQQTPFAQVAQTADLAPNFEAPEVNPYLLKASVREMAANFSRDGTPAERWQWLTKDSRPAMELIEGFVVGCARNDPVTAKQWIESLPVGELRQKAEKSLETWRRDDGPP